MSALDIYRTQREEQVENGNFSEDFIVDPSGAATTIKGIYDESYITDERDQGNVRQQKRKPVILVATRPDNIIPKTTQILVRTETMTIQKIDEDAEGITRMWLL